MALETATSANIDHLTIGASKSDWKSAVVLDSIHDALNDTENDTSVIFYDDNSYASTFLLLLYFARETKGGASGVPQVTAEGVFEVGAHMGFDFGSDPALVTLVMEVTGVEVDNPAKPKVIYYIY
jgi:hypothetical protein